MAAIGQGLAGQVRIGIVPSRLVAWRDRRDSLSRTDERYGLSQFVACKAGVLQILGAGLVIWTSGLPSAIELVRESARAGMESGEGLVTSISQ